MLKMLLSYLNKRSFRLTYPDFSQQFIKQSDASNVAIGAVVGQLKGGKFHPIMYSSKHLSDAESRYSTTEREL
jgi:hypothetical protein